MNEAGLLLRSEKGIPTYISNQAQNRQTTVDLQWLSPECYNWATICRIDTDLKRSHFSDHVAIITELVSNRDILHY
jgi:exonuclease III